jgi:hypothetical protein
MALIPKNYARLESGYREKALKIYPWVCGRCSREFVYSNLRELTVHHIDHDHTNNPEDGSNWELLCLFCHDHEHAKYTEADQYGTTVVAGEDAQKDVGEATYNPFADLKAMLNKKNNIARYARRPILRGEENRTPCRAIPVATSRWCSHLNGTRSRFNTAFPPYFLNN